MQIYNHTLAIHCPHIINNKLASATTFHHQVQSPIDWQSSLKMRPDNVMNGFFLYSLLLNQAECCSGLLLPHDAADQKECLQPALEEWNAATEGIGQENYAHACELCFIVFLDSNGEIDR